MSDDRQLDYRSFFKALTKHAPYPYQERLAQVLFQGHSVVFRAPTGAGKTWGVTAPFLYRLAQGSPMADRLLYALPLRSLATSLHQEVSERMRHVPEFAGLETAVKDRAYNDASRYCSLQIGGVANDPFFESDLVFTTIDQLLSSYLLHPVSLPTRLDNINAGALIGSLVVIDELHLLDARTSLSTTVEMLHRLRPFAQFVLMTATLSDAGNKQIVNVLGAVAFDIPDKEIRALPVQNSKTRTYRWRPMPLESKCIFKDYLGRRAIVLVNTVSRAQQIYQDLKVAFDHLDASASPRPELIQLHARFYQRDRVEKEERVRLLFGPEASAADAILITTQVIEAGMDLSAEELHTELAPMNALIQRAGRVARYGAPRNVGTVTVWDLPLSEDGQSRLGPYRENRSEIDRTREILDSLEAEGQVADYAQELEWVKYVHGADEERSLGHVIGLHDGHPFRRKVHLAMDVRDRSCLSELVRDVSSVNVVVSDSPETLNLAGWDPVAKSRLGWPPMLGVSPVVLQTAFSSSVTTISGEEWVIKAARAVDDESRDLRFDWVPVTSARQLWGEWLVAVHPSYAHYSSELGLVIGESGPVPDNTPEALPPIPRYQYRWEPWVDHSQRIVAQARRMAAANAVAHRRLAEAFGVSEEAIQEWVEVVCALHDVGKLSIDWQECAWRWQEYRNSERARTAGSQLPIAHTDFDPVRDADAYRQSKFRLPNHAVESALSVAMGIDQVLSEHRVEKSFAVWLAMVWSVARHHAPRAGKTVGFQPVPDAQALVREVLPERWAGLKIQSPDAKSVLVNDFQKSALCFADPDRPQVWSIYCHLIRRLRLADQAATRGV